METQAIYLVKGYKSSFTNLRHPEVLGEFSLKTFGALKDAPEMCIYVYVYVYDVSVYTYTILHYYILISFGNSTFLHINKINSDPVSG